MKNITIKMNPFIGPETNMFLMRWNPEISDFSIKRMKELSDYLKSDKGCVKWRWAIRDWQDAETFDLFVMLREGADEKAGIITAGMLYGNPYRGEDWRGSRKKMHYVDMISSKISDPDGVPLVSIDELVRRISDIDWNHGHCGVLMTEEQKEIMFDIFKENMPYEWTDDCWDDNFGDEEV
ncbi:MAG: hypothetical protein K2N08_09210 [Muribaculaceae bacterium]|nr:hypothetical protein [Muribaculaceae bacterium]